MAKKGQKFKHYSKDLKLLVVQEYLSHKYSLQSLARKYNISSIETILHWAQDYCKDGELAFEEKEEELPKKIHLLKVDLEFALFPKMKKKNI